MFFAHELTSALGRTGVSPSPKSTRDPWARERSPLVCRSIGQGPSTPVETRFSLRRPCPRRTSTTTRRGGPTCHLGSEGQPATSSEIDGKAGFVWLWGPQSADLQASGYVDRCVALKLPQSKASQSDSSTTGGAFPGMRKSRASATASRSSPKRPAYTSSVIAAEA